MRKLQTLCLFLLAPLLLSAQGNDGIFVKLLKRHQKEGDLLERTVIIKNLETINSNQSDYSPIYSSEGIIFTSNRPSTDRKGIKKLLGKRYADLYFAERKDDGQYSMPSPLKGKVNGRFNEGAATVNADGTRMIFTRNNSNGRNAYGNVDLKLYSAELVNGKWAHIRELPFNCDDCTTAHPSLSPDGSLLYFASNRAGGFGGMDIYVAEWVDGNWLPPKNLGPKINTVENEIFPFIHATGTLYYATNGRHVREDLDIYFNHPTENGWNKSEALDGPFNSPFDDFGFVLNPDGQSGLMASNRPGGLGEDDIYAWHLHEKVALALQETATEVQFSDEWRQKSTAGLRIQALELDASKGIFPQLMPIAFLDQVSEGMIRLRAQPKILYTDSSGTITLNAAFQKDYLIRSQMPGFLPVQYLLSESNMRENPSVQLTILRPLVLPTYQTQNMLFALATEEVEEEWNNLAEGEQSSSEIDLATATASSEASFTALPPPEPEPQSIYSIGEALPVGEITFGARQIHLSQEAENQLRPLLQLMLDHPEVEIELSAHTDTRGEMALNQKISQHRADQAKMFLVQRGVAGSRILSSGKGGQLPLYDCVQGDCKEIHRLRNQRIEAHVSRIRPPDELKKKEE